MWKQCLLRYSNIVAAWFHSSWCVGKSEITHCIALFILSLWSSFVEYLFFLLLEIINWFILFMKPFACWGLNLTCFPPPHVLDLEEASLDGSSGKCARTYFYMHMFWCICCNNSVWVNLYLLIHLNNLFVASACTLFCSFLLCFMCACFSCSVVCSSALECCCYSEILQFLQLPWWFFLSHSHPSTGSLSLGQAPR